jgi:uncharacterized protein YfbU (UPF0304 family)
MPAPKNKEGVMELIKKDCLYLLNEHMMLYLLERESGNRCSQIITTLENGFEIFYSYVHDQIPLEISQVGGRFVYDVLSIYGSIEPTKGTIWLMI